MKLHSKQQYNKIDELIEKAEEMERKSPAKILPLAQSAHEMATILHYPKGITDSLLMIGRAYLYLGNLNEANQYLWQAYESNPGLKQLAKILNALGIVHLYLKMYDKAFTYYQKSIELAKIMKDLTLEARVLNNMGEIYRENKDFFTALKYYDSSIEKYDALLDTTSTCVPLANMGAVYLELGQLDNAEFYSDKAITVARKTNDQMIVSVCLGYLGIVANKRGKRETALKYFNESLDIYNNTHENIHAIEILLEFHKLYFEEGNWEMCLNYLNDALNIAEELDSLSKGSIIYSELAKVYEAMGKTKEALHYFNKNIQTLESINIEECKQRLRGIEVQIQAQMSFQEKESFRKLNLELEDRSKQLKDAYNTLNSISKIGKMIIATLSLEKVFKLIDNHISNLMETDLFGIGIYKPETDFIEYKYLVEDGKLYSDVRIPLSNINSLAVWCFNNRKGILINSDQEDVSCYVDTISSSYGEVMQALMFQPLTVEGQTIGIISVQSKKKDVYTNQSLITLEMLASYISIAIYNAQQSEKLRAEILQRRRAQRELNLLNQELENLSNQDSLTKIANRRSFEEFFHQMWNKAMQRQKNLSLLIIDIDYFKQYNDNYGHLAGDQIIKKVASLISQNIKRKEDLVARLGGDEFVVVLFDTNSQCALKVAHEILATISERGIKHGHSSISPNITVSIGVATMIPSSGTNPNHLFENVDLALYQSKQNGRNQIQVFENNSFPHTFSS